ncbi:hypothetical protein DMA15_34645 [Streptomyces sp. WAC 01529]|nr:hypothetical protein DMA15_34645 [Streptomyces sp. WAC 01529]
MPLGAAEASASQAPTRKRDVCIVGGGASGTYTAMRLRQLGKSVLLVERSDRLGGHTETHRDPVTGDTTEIGVVLWRDLPAVRGYFKRLGVPVEVFSGHESKPPKYADFRTGAPVNAPASPPDLMTSYFKVLKKYPYLATGYDLPDPVPAELYMPFAKFAAKHGLEALVPLLVRVMMGFGDLLTLPTLYVMKSFDIDMVSRLLNGGSFLTTKSGNNSELYEKAATHLDDDVLLNAELIRVNRSRDLVTIRVGTPQGLQTILAKKIVFTAPPTQRNLAPFDLDRTERTLFSRFRPHFYYTGLVRLPGVPDTMTVQNLGSTPPFHMPALPALYHIQSSGVPGLHHVKYGSTVPLTYRQVRANIHADIKRLVAAGTIPATTVKLSTLKSHSPYGMSVSADDIANGFYRRLNALQGRNRTFYNGAAFHAHDSSLLWQFTERLLPNLT